MAMVGKTVGAIKADSGLVRGFNVQPDECGAGRESGSLVTAQQLGGYAAAAECGSDFDGLDIGDAARRGLAVPLDDGEAGDLGILFGDPGCRIDAGDKALHVDPAVANGRLETEFFDGVERGEVGGVCRGGGIEHGQRSGS